MGVHNDFQIEICAQAKDCSPSENGFIVIDQSWRMIASAAFYFRQTWDAIIANLHERDQDEIVLPDETSLNFLGRNLGHIPAQSLLRDLSCLGALLVVEIEVGRSGHTCSSRYLRAPWYNTICRE